MCNKDNMKLKILLLLIITVCCSENNPVETEVVEQDAIDFPYGKPKLLAPKDSTIYYSHEQMKIEWELPDSLIHSEIQGIWIPEFYNPTYLILFDSTSFIGGYGNQYAHIFSYMQPELFDSTLYLAYRVRATGPKGNGEWSEIKSICIKPFNNLIIKSKKIKIDVNFTAYESYRYYSGLVTNLTFSYDSLLNSFNYNKNDIKVVRPISGKLYYHGDASSINRKIERYVVGIGNLSSDSMVAHPFDVLSDTYSLNSDNGESGMMIYPNAGRYRNLKSFLETNNLYHLSYFLTDPLYIGENFSFTVEFNLDFYLMEE